MRRALVRARIRPCRVAIRRSIQGASALFARSGHIIRKLTIYSPREHSFRRRTVHMAGRDGEVSPRWLRAVSGAAIPEKRRLVSQGGRPRRLSPLRRRGAALLVGVSPGREHRCSDTRACGERERIHFVEKRESGSAILRAGTKQAARWAACEIRGANERIRTADLRITSALLYQLSHVGASMDRICRRTSDDWL